MLLQNTQCIFEEQKHCKKCTNHAWDDKIRQAKMCYQNRHNESLWKSEVELPICSDGSYGIFLNLP